MQLNIIFSSTELWGGENTFFILYYYIISVYVLLGHKRVHIVKFKFKFSLTQNKENIEKKEIGRTIFIIKIGREKKHNLQTFT